MSDKFRFIFERPADCYAIGLTRDVVEKMRPAVSLDDIPADERVNACQAELMSHLMTAYDDLAPASYFAACSVTLILLHALGKLDACLAPDVAGVGVFLEYDPAAPEPRTGTLRVAGLEPEMVAVALAALHDHGGQHRDLAAELCAETDRNGVTVH